MPLKIYFEYFSENVETRMFECIEQRIENDKNEMMDGACWDVHNKKYMIRIFLHYQQYVLNVV